MVITLIVNTTECLFECQVLGKFYGEIIFLAYTPKFINAMKKRESDIQLDFSF